ncbi:MAG: amidase [Rhizobiaceae bacterium]|nr:amidase [Rhizobiaceae bacterium]
MSELTEIGGVAAGRLIAQGRLSPVELTSAYLARIEALEPKLHAFAHVMADQAMAQARTCEAEIAAGLRKGPLHGVPVAVKDLCETADAPTAAGFPMFADRRAGHDATVVERIRASGAVLIGKTQLSEGALAIHHPDVTLPVNPWRADLWTGSSSSGSGVAAAAELCAAAIGSDTGGSIRFPAICNAVVGIKPTWGRVSRHGVFPLSWTLDHVGPLARRVEDAAALLGIVAGRDERDPTSLAAPVPDYLDDGGTGLAGLRLGFDESYATDGVLPETAAILKRAIEVLGGRGTVLKAVTMPQSDAAQRAWTPICLSEALCVHQDLKGADPAGYSDSFKQFLAAGAAVSGAEYARANLARRQFAGNLDALFETIDLMVVPVTPNPVPTVDEFHRICPDPEGLERLIRFTCIYDVSGHPTITLPAGLSSAGEPLAFQLVGPRLSEHLLIRAGLAWQADFGWRARPPL